MKTPEELAEEGSTHRDGCEKGRRFNIPCSCGSFEKTLRAIRLGQVEALDDVAKEIGSLACEEDNLLTNTDYKGGSVTRFHTLNACEGIIRAKADAIEKEARK